MAPTVGTEPRGELESRVDALVARVEEPDPVWRDRAWARLDSLTKPPRSLGRLEELAAALALAQGTERPLAEPAAIVVFAGDHGVTAEGVSPYPQDVTAQMVATFASGGAAVNQLAVWAGARLMVVDVGVATDTSSYPDVIQAKVRPGTANLALGPAMSREQAAQAMLVGAEVAERLAAEGVRVFGAGEMGIGNSTSAAALVAVLTGGLPADVTGRGTGLDDEGLSRKVAVIERGLAANRVTAADALGALAALGGLEIAGMAGLMLGSAAAGACTVADGFISSAAALVALGLCPAARARVFASHVSAEPGHRLALEALDLDPVLDLDMRLGEGTGAALAIGLMRAACDVMNGMATFRQAGVSGREQS